MLALSALLVLVAAAAAPFVRNALLRDPPAGLVATNFRGRQVPVVGGVVIVATILVGAAVHAALVLAGPLVAGPRFAATSPTVQAFHSSTLAGLLLLSLGFFALGLLDDAAGPGRARGFRGHLGALRQGRVTTGLVKAAGGGALGLVAGRLWEASAAAAVLDALLVALSANHLNLLDLRPGRATKAFVVAWAPLAVAAAGSPYLPFSVLVGVAALAWLPADLDERGMLGDAGANLLGAVLGAGLALEAGGGVKVAALAVLTALTAASERWSFSASIERVGVLRWLDGLGRPAVPGEAGTGGPKAPEEPQDPDPPVVG